MYYYINFFFLTSFLGFLVETIMKTFFFHSMNNGILFGPWIPVYGFGCILIIVLEKFIFGKLKVNSFFKIVLQFISVFILITFLEWSGGVLIEKLFNDVFWDYSDLKFNIGPYIAIEMSLLWAFISIIFIYFIRPVIDLIIKKIPKWLSILILVLFLIDVFFTTLKLI